MQPHKRELRNFVVGGKDIFEYWLDGLKDAAGRTVILNRLDRVCGGDKGTQWRDIRRAQVLWDKYLRER